MGFGPGGESPLPGARRPPRGRPNRPDVAGSARTACCSS